MKKPINVIWSGPHKPNWGDELNKTLVNYLSGSEVHYGTHVDKHYLCIGSILIKILLFGVQVLLKKMKKLKAKVYF